MVSPFFIRLRLLLSTVGVPFFSLATVAPAWAEATVAYCDSPLYAVNVYQDSILEPTEATLNIRIFWREKALTFADLPADRSRFFAEGIAYTSQSELSDDYSSSLWTLFVPDSEGRSCLLFRNGVAFDSGDVTQREEN